MFVMDICLHGKIEHRIWIKSPVTEGSTLFVMIHERWSWCSWKLQALLFSLCRAEQEGTRLPAVDMQPFLDFVKRDNLQTEFFSIRTNQCECRTCWLFTAFREPAKLVMSSLSPEFVIDDYDLQIWSLQSMKTGFVPVVSTAQSQEVKEL